MRTDLVISHYAADLSWLAPLARPGLNFCIYTKGPGPCYLPVIRLPNVGKNDHTYLTHIIENYGDLADWTLFCPDHPHDHLAGMTIAEGLEPSDEVRVPWVCTVRDWDEHGRIKWHEFTNRPDRNGTNYADRFASGKITKAELNFPTWAQRFLGFSGANLVPHPGVQHYWSGYAPGGIMGVPRKAIRQYPPMFYARLRDQLSNSVEPEEGHYLERLWVSIFQGKAKYIPEQEHTNGRATEGGRPGAAEVGRTDHVHQGS